MNNQAEDNAGLVNEEELDRLRAIFDRNRKIETDEDLLELAELTEEDE